MPIREAMIPKLRELALSGDARALNLQRRILDEAGWNQTEKLDPEEKKQRVLNLLRGMGVTVKNDGDGNG